MANKEIKYDVVVIHGIGNENGKKFGFSDKLKSLVVSRCVEAQAHWIEAPWEELNDPIDNEIGAVVEDLLGGYFQEATTAFLKSEPTLWSQDVIPEGWLSKIVFLLCRKMPKIAWFCQKLIMALNVYLLTQSKEKLPSVLDALIDLPLYMWPERAKVVRDEIQKAFERVPENSGGVVLVGHSLGSVIAFDLFVEELRKGPEKCRIKKLVTFGTPLAWVMRIRKALVSQGMSSLICDASVGDGLWVNFYDKEDPVCLRTKLDNVTFAGVENIQVDSSNKFIKAHCAYWENPDIADRIVSLMKGLN